MKKTGSSRIDTIFVLIVFSIFAFSVLMVLVFGASIYKNINSIAREGQNERTVLSYVRSKVKNNDGAGKVMTGRFNDLPALFVYEEQGDSVYRTVIYHYDGWLYEIYSAEALDDFDPDGGIRITLVDKLEFETLTNGLIKITAGDLSILLSPRGGSSPRGIIDSIGGPQE